MWKCLRPFDNVERDDDTGERKEVQLLFLPELETALVGIKAALYGLILPMGGWASIQFVAPG